MLLITFLQKTCFLWKKLDGFSRLLIDIMEAEIPPPHAMDTAELAAELASEAPGVYIKEGKSTKKMAPTQKDMLSKQYQHLLFG